MVAIGNVVVLLVVALASLWPTAEGSVSHPTLPVLYSSTGTVQAMPAPLAVSMVQATAGGGGTVVAAVGDAAGNVACWAPSNTSTTYAGPSTPLQLCANQTVMYVGAGDVASTFLAVCGTAVLTVVCGPTAMSVVQVTSVNGTVLAVVDDAATDNVLLALIGGTVVMVSRSGAVVWSLQLAVTLAAPVTAACSLSDAHCWLADATGLVVAISTLRGEFAAAYNTTLSGDGIIMSASLAGLVATDGTRVVFVDPSRNQSEVQTFRLPASDNTTRATAVVAVRSLGAVFVAWINGTSAANSAAFVTRHDMDDSLQVVQRSPIYTLSTFRAFTYDATAELLYVVGNNLGGVTAAVFSPSDLTQPLWTSANVSSPSTPWSPSSFVAGVSGAPVVFVPTTTDGGILYSASWDDVTSSMNSSILRRAIVTTYLAQASPRLTVIQDKLFVLGQPVMSLGVELKVFDLSARVATVLQHPAQWPCQYVAATTTTGGAILAAVFNSSSPLNVDFYRSAPLGNATRVLRMTLPANPFDEVPTAAFQSVLNGSVIIAVVTSQREYGVSAVIQSFNASTGLPIADLVLPRGFKGKVHHNATVFALLALGGFARFDVLTGHAAFLGPLNKTAPSYSPYSTRNVQVSPNGQLLGFSNEYQACDVVMSTSNGTVVYSSWSDDSFSFAPNNDYVTCDFNGAVGYTTPDFSWAAPQYPNINCFSNALFIGDDWFQLVVTGYYTQRVYLARLLPFPSFNYHAIPAVMLWSSYEYPSGSPKVQAYSRKHKVAVIDFRLPSLVVSVAVDLIEGSVLWTSGPLLAATDGDPEHAFIAPNVVVTQSGNMRDLFTGAVLETMPGVDGSVVQFLTLPDGSPAILVPTESSYAIYTGFAGVPKGGVRPPAGFRAGTGPLWTASTPATTLPVPYVPPSPAPPDIPQSPTNADGSNQAIWAGVIIGIVVGAACIATVAHRIRQRMMRSADYLAIQDGAGLV